MRDIRVATVQFQHAASDKAYNLGRVRHFVGEAARSPTVAVETLVVELRPRQQPAFGQVGVRPVAGCVVDHMHRVDRERLAEQRVEALRQQLLAVVRQDDGAHAVLRYAHGPNADG